MNNIWWKTIGNKNYHLVLLHGWGFNSEIWNYINEKLSSHFTLHLIDLPGFGRSYGFDIMKIEEMAKCILEYVPNKAIWIGWSMGGIIASKVALIFPKYVRALVTVASSPCFSARKEWPGILPEMLNNFQQQLKVNFKITMDNFLRIQMLGIKNSKKIINDIEKSMLSVPNPNINILNEGIEIIKNIDLRRPLINLQIPHLRIYGYLDVLVPHKIINILDTYWPKSKSLIIRNAAHMPFISHPLEFCKAIVSLNQNLK